MKGAVAVVGTAVTLLVGCGASDRERFIEQADAICIEVAAETERMRARWAEVDDIDAAADLARDLARSNENLLADLRALDVPDDAPEIDAWLAAIEEMTANSVEFAAAVESGDTAAIRRLTAAQNELNRNLEPPSDFGFEQCGEGP